MDPGRDDPFILGLSPHSVGTPRPHSRESTECSQTNANEKHHPSFDTNNSTPFPSSSRRRPLPSLSPPTILPLSLFTPATSLPPSIHQISPPPQNIVMASSPSGLSKLGEYLVIRSLGEGTFGKVKRMLPHFPISHSNPSIESFKTCPDLTLSLLLVAVHTLSAQKVALKHINKGSINAYKVRGENRFKSILCNPL